MPLPTTARWLPPNWGAAFTPRIGTKVLVDFVHAYIDRPIIVGSLHNPADAQP